ncbi:MAG: NAD(P)/FAD-dependent oxidoreductase [Deltaproteobacteria bacterium]|nr:NAD(P)/FAD-dependent oxidoreductase [Deltaproteobacteria bacterium]
MTSKKIIVIGGGPAGLMAAGQAARAGAEVTVFEKMKQPGRKLCITGKGRCNITNIAEKRDLFAHFGKSGKFLHQVFNQFANTELMEFFAGRRLELVKERGGRVFTASGKAQDVYQCLLKWLSDAGVKIKKSAPVTALLIKDNRVRGVISRHNEFRGDAVILAVGGASYPLTGSTGDGYRLAEAAGHKIIAIRPALVPLETRGNIAARLAGLSLRNIKIGLYIDNKKKKDAFGEMAFVKFGIAGPLILTLSGEIVDYLAAGRRVDIAIDLKPALDTKKLDARLRRDLEKRHKECVDSLLRGLLPREMVPVCLEMTGIPAERLAGEVTAKERRRLKIWLKDFRIQVTGRRPVSEAIVTAGGVDTREIEPRTMESRLIRGLFFAGEIMDIQADTGGYNLQAAFSTGWLAGTASRGGFETRPKHQSPPDGQV